jgi:hypothetical protein
MKKLGIYNDDASLANKSETKREKKFNHRETQSHSNHFIRACPVPGMRLARVSIQTRAFWEETIKIQDAQERSQVARSAWRVIAWRQ